MITIVLWKDVFHSLTFSTSKNVFGSKRSSILLALQEKTHSLLKIPHNSRQGSSSPLFLDKVDSVNARIYVRRLLFSVAITCVRLHSIPRSQWAPFYPHNAVNKNRTLVRTRGRAKSWFWMHFEISDSIYSMRSSFPTRFHQPFSFAGKEGKNSELWI